MTLDFCVFGNPSPKGSKTAVVRGGRAVMLDARTTGARAKYDAWKSAIATHAAIAHGDRAPLDGPLAISVVFMLPRRKNETRAQRARMWHTTRPDADKLLRAVLDPLTALVIADDARIAIVRVEKRFAPSPAETGAKISITQIHEGD